MKRKHTTIWQFLKRALRHTWLWLYGGLWVIFGNATRIRDNFLPSSWKQALETHRLLNLIPQMGWQSWVIGIMAGVIFAIARSALLQIRERESAHFGAQDEIEHLKQVPLTIDLQVHEIIHRASFENHPNWSRDMFLRITIELKMPISVDDLKYELAVIRQGKTLKTEWLPDVEQWCRMKRQIGDILYDRSNHNSDRSCYLMDELPTSLNVGQKIDGWLHFRSGWLPESELRHCKLRLTTESARGAHSHDMPEGSFAALPGEWKVVLQKEAARA